MTKIAASPYAGMSREESYEYQLREWVKGNSTHNLITGECCPDFSCCNPSLQASEEARRAFVQEGEEIRHQMLGMFLGGMINAYCEEEGKDSSDVHIAGIMTEESEPRQ